MPKKDSSSRMVAVVKHVSINDKADDVVVDITDECSFRRMDSAEDSSYVNSLDSMAPTQRLRDMIDEFTPSNSAIFSRGFQVKGTSFQDCADGHAFLINAALGLDILAEEKLRFIFDTLDPDRTGSISLGQVEKLLESSFPIAKLEYKDLDTKSIASLLFRKAKAPNKYMTYTQFRCAFLKYVTDSYWPSNPHHVNASGNCGNLHGGIDGKTFLIDGDQELDTSAEAKLRSIFDMIDTNRTGSISLGQVEKLLETNISNAKLQIVGMDVKSVAALLVHEAKARDGSMNFTQFCDVFQGYVAGSYRLDKQPTDLELSFNSTSRHALSPGSSKFAKWYDKNKVRIWWLVIYAIANNVAFWLKWFSYKVDPALGYGLRIARACAQVAMLNVLLLFMPMLRSITQVMKRSRLLWRYIPFDDHIEAHKICGSVCLIAGIVHTLAHVSNEIHLYLIATPDEIQRSVFVERKVKAFENGLPPFSVMLQAIPVWTGVILIVITAISFPLAAFPKLRGGNFNVFWYSHMLFGVFLFVLCFHGATSWLAHASSYWWVGPPFALYLIERRYRYAKTFAAPVRILEAVELEQTCAVFMEKPRRFVYRPGMYLYINCPIISSHEWHPFTISSAPDDNYVSIHMKNAGDWTGAFHKLIADCHANKTLYPEVYLDGPVGAPTQDYHRYTTVICVGGGIGIMPFASILKDVVHLWVQHSCTNCQHVRHPSSFKIQKLYFHWTTREQESLGWFAKTLNQITAMDRDNIIEAHQYLTSVKDSDNTSQLKMFQQFVHDQTGRDFVSGLETKMLTHFGRPDWDQVFQDARRAHAGEKVGVFFCGPHPLEKVLDQMCKKYSDPTPGGTIFDYHSEKFG